MTKKKLDMRPGDIMYIPEVKDILTDEELCRRWGGEVTPGTLAQWRSMKMGPKYVKLGGKDGRKIVYRLAAVEAYERKNEITPK